MVLVVVVCYSVGIVVKMIIGDYVGIVMVIVIEVGLFDNIELVVGLVLMGVELVVLSVD